MKHVYYEGDFHKLRSDYPFLRSLDDLIHAGCDIADDELDDARRQVRPDHIAHMMFTSVRYIHILLLSLFLHGLFYKITCSIYCNSTYYE